MTDLPKDDRVSYAVAASWAVHLADAASMFDLCSSTKEPLASDIELQEVARLLTLAAEATIRAANQLRAGQ